MSEIILRNLIEETDLPFIIDSWLKSYFGHSFFTNGMARSFFFYKHPQIIKHLINKSTVLLAVKSDDPEIILGYIVFEKDWLHYVYVKESFRHFGVCKKLISEAKFVEDKIKISHLTARGRKIQLRMGLAYNPYFEGI